MSSILRYLETLEEQEKSVLSIISSSAIKTLDDHRYYLGHLEAYRVAIGILKSEFKEIVMTRTNKGLFNATDGFFSQTTQE